MTLTILSEEVDRLAEALTARRHVDKVAAVKLALENELRRGYEALALRERMRPIQERIMARPPTGLEADKAFYDELRGDIER